MLTVYRNEILCLSTGFRVVLLTQLWLKTADKVIFVHYLNNAYLLTKLCISSAHVSGKASTLKSKSLAHIDHGRLPITVHIRPYLCILPHTQRSCRGGGNKYIGYIGFTPSVRPSVGPAGRPASRVRSRAPTVLVGFIWYLYILSSNFRSCVTCKVTCNNLKIWLGIWCESLVRVTMWRLGVSQNAGVLVVLVNFSLNLV